MAEYIHLIGAEDVRRASNQIQNAASDMIRAASAFENSLHQHMLFMEEWLGRLETVLTDKNSYPRRSGNLEKGGEKK